MDKVTQQRMEALNRKIAEEKLYQRLCDKPRALKISNYKLSRLELKLSQIQKHQAQKKQRGTKYGQELIRRQQNLQQSDNKIKQLQLELANLRMLSFSSYCAPLQLAKIKLLNRESTRNATLRRSLAYWEQKEK